MIRTIVAKYHDKCKMCGEPINPGDLVRWGKGRGCVHVDCDALGYEEGGRHGQHAPDLDIALGY